MFSISAKMGTDSSRKAAQNFMKETKDQKLYSTGKAPPVPPKDASNWMEDVIGEPQPLNIR